MYLKNAMNDSTFINKKMAALAVEHPAEAYLLRGIAAALVFIAIAYLYLVSVSILNVMARADASARAARVESQTALLEQEYFALTHAITPESASELGLAPVAETSYVYRPGSIGAASFVAHATFQ